MLIGTAKAMPLLSPDLDQIAVLMPISRPRLSINAPPELPLFTAASVWMKSCNPSPIPVRPRPEITPMVSVWSNPNG